MKNETAKKTKSPFLKSGLHSFSKKNYILSKWMIDKIVALLGLFLAFPIILIFSVLIILESPGSPFFRQERLGLHGGSFKIIKLRSMKRNAEKNGAQWAVKNDPRTTKIGAFMRKTRIDELPQFINILKGDMSLVGPRPERPVFTKKFQKEIPEFTNRLFVKPGLTGWAQINGGYDITPKEKLELDMYYIHNANLVLDVKILFKTAHIVVTGNGSR
ncbi:sugar transferase [Bacillus cereus]|uniref:sugar transferase n=1 Tax=Bacillus cereus TaxID=1396 RepID=UPI003C2BBFDB